MSSPDPKAIAAIERRLDEYICGSNVLAGGSIEHPYDSTQIPLAKEVLKHNPCKNFLREIDVHEIVSMQMFRSLQDVEVKEKAALTEVLGAERVKVLKQEVLSYLKSIPRRYYVCFKLPAVKLPGMSRVVLTQDVDLFTVSKNDSLPAIRDSALKTIADLYAPSPGLNVGKTYLRFHVSGFASNWSLDSSALATAYSRFRQLVQLAVSLGLLQADRSAGFHQRSSLLSEVFVYADPDERSERKSITLPFSVSHFVATLTFDESKLTVPGGLLAPDRPAATEEERTAGIARLLQHGLLLLDADDSEESGNAIRAALEWGFEAATNQNETFAFVQACVGIEALLGEELDAETGLTRQLADRCAFLLGETRADRAFIRKHFSDLYRTRSKLVHGKALRLSEADKNHLIQATALLEELVKVELASFVREDRLRKKKGTSTTSCPSA